MPATLIRRANPLGWLAIAAAVCAWGLASATAGLEYLPGPVDVGAELVDLVTAGELLAPLWHTLSVTLLASLIACGIGLALGLLIGLVPAVRTYALASVDILRTVPVIALMPVALLLWGPSLRTELIVAAYAATWPMLVNTVGGVTGVEPGLREVARMFALSRPARVWKVIVPAAMPALLVGARLAIVTALVVAVVAEMLVNLEGIGWELVQSQQALQPARMWAWVVISGVLGYLLNAALVAAVRRALPGGGANVGLNEAR